MVINFNLSSYLYNYSCLLNNTNNINTDFIIGISQIIQSKQINFISSLLIDNIKINIYNIAPIANCNSSLILLDKIQNSGIIYSNTQL